MRKVRRLEMAKRKEERRLKTSKLAKKAATKKAAQV
ncbi:Uncharacterised protein [Chlamydia trachomatis]|uniref:Uncharacterized protein n=1 Tax=Mesomycoplasma hyorhinis (strain MCLD) TaxID=936139 RepID=A0ABM5M694_MESHM|nr:hypothetical protein SRH_03090 [Mesomycoplasma hyorhinis MCLD]AEX14325.1 hypothetical protein MYM_0584 [Mesomycoplasma hyorhinis GDL-1]AHA41335.1 hypothetical protein Q453_0624 [Mesomycoplasma hyorhinis DBS 1050]CRH24587.1 Uncharacterised protein [Chlamydia trachomatis]VEU58087.1 Uncharacterised protein [Mesomycoplasma hyorhinis]